MEPSSNMPEEQMPPDLTDVWVDWCGNGFSVTIPPDASIGALKRRVNDVRGLPIKRQRHKASVVNRPVDKPEYVTNVELQDDDRLISSLTQPPATHLIGLNEVDNELYKQEYNKVDGKRTCIVTEVRKKNYLTDSDDKKTEWVKGKYTVGMMTTDCLVRRYEPGHKSEILCSLRLMNKWRHPNVVTLENMYERRPNCYLVVSSSFDETFAGWLRQNQPLNEDGTFSPVFNGLMLDLLAVMDKLVQRRIRPKSLTTNNLYVKMLNDQPQLKVLIDKAESLNTKKDMLLCAEIKNIMISIGSLKMHRETKAFCDFIGEHGHNYIGTNLAKVAKSYPIQWSDEDKSKYLIGIMSSNRQLNQLINKHSGISWPKNKSGDDICEELQKLRAMFEEANQWKAKEKAWLEQKGEQEKADRIRYYVWNYDTRYPNDLVKLVRNLWKHYATYPDYIKRHLGGSQNAILGKFETWCPDVWILIYNVVGLP
ncbi:uncharacterized protein LOC119270644 isoform X2 [Triticum dicoccoides]|nr:uncharacterized protein LOC119270644 isoform X2 [Triticum dicoccoides]